MEYGRSGIAPTTKAQVSGHRFLQARLEHAMVLGDIRMIHDPLAARRRAMIFGIVAVLVLAVGAGLMAWLRPNASPGDAVLWRSADHELFVLIDETLHPLPNLTSARLLLGEPVEATAVGESAFKEVARGTPLGIYPAPGPVAPPGEIGVAVCHAGPVGGEPSVWLRGGEEHPFPQPLGANRVVLAVGEDGQEWLLNREGRYLLPREGTVEGKVLRRALKIDAHTPRWYPPTAVLNALGEQVPLRVPERLPDYLLDAGVYAGQPSTFAVYGDSRQIQRPTATQVEILQGLGVRVEMGEYAHIADWEDAPTPADPGLYEADVLHFTIPPAVVDPQEVGVCADDSGGILLLPESVTTSVPARILPGGSIVATGHSSVRGAHLVSTGHGLFVLDESAVLYPVADQTAALALGLDPEHASEVPWELLRMLPQGPLLSHEAAMQALEF